jgi:mannose-6-phosphate isomerase-like protein (cupin superfamily)
MMRQSCRDFVDEVVLPFIKQNWQREWSMVPEDRLPLRILVMGYRVPKGAAHAAPGQLPKANLRDVKLQVVGSHPPSTLYQLLLGTTESKRDQLAVAATVTSLFIMEFAPGGTNNPHRHKGEEEVYLLLDGHGDMVAGNEKRPATAGDAYYFPPDTTVGFYNGNVPGEPKARILAVRSTAPKE